MKRIAIDMDEVIADAYHRWQEWYERDFQRKITEEEMRGKYLKDAVPIEHREKVLQYVHSEDFFKDLPVMEDAKEVIFELSKKYEIFIASAAMEFKYSLVPKYDWLQEHFPFIKWSHFVFCGDKSILNADYLMDDHVRHFKYFNGQGILFTSPHNLDEVWNPRVNNWKQVGDLLL